MDEGNVPRDSENALQEDLDNLAVDLSDRDRIMPPVNKGRRRRVDGSNLREGERQCVLK